MKIIYILKTKKWKLSQGMFKVAYTFMEETIAWQQGTNFKVNI